MSLKITFIGAGSLVFARTLFTDIMSVPELQKAAISFTDKSYSTSYFSVVTISLLSSAAAIRSSLQLYPALVIIS